MPVITGERRNRSALEGLVRDVVGWFAITLGYGAAVVYLPFLGGQASRSDLPVALVFGALVATSIMAGRIVRRRQRAPRSAAPEPQSS